MSTRYYPSPNIKKANSAAYEKSKIVKADSGTLYRIVGYNSKGSAQFIQVHDTTTVPADTAIPIATFTVATAANFVIDFGAQGLPLSTGITVCNSSTGPTKTIGSDDCFFTVIYS